MFKVSDWGKIQCFYGVIGSQGSQSRVEGEVVGGKKVRIGTGL